MATKPKQTAAAVAVAVAIGTFSIAESDVLRAADGLIRTAGILKDSLTVLLGDKAPGTDVANVFIKLFMDKIRTFDAVVLSAKQLKDSNDEVKRLALRRYDAVRQSYNRMKPGKTRAATVAAAAVVVVEIPLEPAAAGNAVQSAISRLQAIPAEQRRIGTDKLIAAYQALYAVIGEMLAAIPTK